MPRVRLGLDPIWKPAERLTYRLCGIDPEKEQHWKHYTISMLLFSLFTMMVTYALLRLQTFIPLQHFFNPQALPAISDHLAFDTAASFTTNTNWQSYGGESTMSYFLADGGADQSEFLFGGGGNCDRCSLGSRHSAALRRDGRQFLGRPGPHHLLPAASRSASFSRSFSSRRE